MYIRVKTTPNSPRKSVQICETYRKDGKVKQRIVRYVGIAMNEEEVQKLKDLATEFMANMLIEKAKELNQASLFATDKKELKSCLKKKAGRRRRKKLEEILPPSKVTLDEIEEESRIVEGIHEVGGKLFDETYQNLFKQKRTYQCLKDLVLARIVHPASKHKLQKKLLHNFGKEYSLDRIYRTMDKVFPAIGMIKQLTFNKTKSLFPEQIDLLLFDVTTLYFESITTDDLRNFGYSKDHRFNTTQVVLALATNQDGLPVGYELFSGNTAEVKTLGAAVESWKKLFHINEVCFVGDRAMFSKANIELMEKNNYQYIIAAKLKSLPEDLKKNILCEENYQATVLKEELAWIGEFNYQNQRLIVSYKTKRALKDQKDRQKILDKIKKQLGAKGTPGKLITNQGVKKFVSVSESAGAFLDDDKIELATQWDGLHGIITNIEKAPATSLIARYARLWVIEESFRINKHQLKMRPIFHWKSERIHAHIAICYMAFSIVRHLQYRVNLMQKVSVDCIIDELLNVQASIYKHKKNGDLYRIPGSFSNNARKIYKALDIVRPLDATIYEH